MLLKLNQPVRPFRSASRGGQAPCLERKPQLGARHQFDIIVGKFRAHAALMVNDLRYKLSCRRRAVETSERRGASSTACKIVFLQRRIDQPLGCVENRQRGCLHWERSCQHAVRIETLHLPNKQLRRRSWYAAADKELSHIMTRPNLHVESASK